MGLILAIVGSLQFARDPEALAWAALQINDAIERIRPSKIISGGAKGIDELAVICADANGIPYDEYLPKNPRWKPDGYMERNLQIASICDHLLCIRHYASSSYGSGWTADRADDFGKNVDRIMFEKRDRT